MTLDKFENYKARRLFLFSIFVISLVSVAALPMSKVSVDLLSFTPLFWPAGIFIAVSFYCYFREMPVLAAALETVGFGLLVTFPVLLLTYLVISLDLPLADAKLDAMDRALGFDWFALISFVDARPLLAKTLDLAYRSISFQLALIPVALVVSGRQPRAYAMVTGYGIVCVLASAIALFFPALGTYAFYGYGYDSVVNIYPYFALSPVPEFIAVREHAAYTVSLASTAGLICFPSVHAGVAYMCAWAAWDLKWLRYPILALNAVMAVSAIAIANHYLVDIILGFGVAGLATSAVTALFLSSKRQSMGLAQT
ncbi:phosphatase PAP2 family protein [Mesorhizobium sp. INR15]|uniref:phosphatase PAP2 family protein n=1 Tax=Mesorhizobium sp. INR15 TaxID=2654248 RepID=UPI00189677C2|nr:phosphatase PAP2 family protein [Mesorhizobium sp. INR15]QPC92308.1 PAP2 family protein [Mesorhizobium sp. INR15]